MKNARCAALLLFAALLFPVALAAAPIENPLLSVNPFIGTSQSIDGTDVIDDFPGADVPFGMVQWSPDTPSQNAGGGYEYGDKQITGFSLTHLAGPGCSVFGDFGILPTVGALADPAKAAQPFSHAGEEAAPGYYAVTVGSPGIRTQLTVTKRTGLGEFDFPASDRANLLFNASSDQSGVDDAHIRIVGNDQIEGSATTGHFCGMPDAYTVYFVARFDRPFTSYGTWKNASVLPGAASSDGAGTGGWVTFDTRPDSTIRVKVGLSFVSYDGALANLRAENTGWNFTQVRNSAAAAWQRVLGRVAVQGGSPDERAIFYTALYHALLHPNVESDVTGNYPGFDGRTHRVRAGHEEYANFSGWDIYRTQAPLMGLVAPREASDAAQSLVDAAQQGGWLPKWALVNGYTAVMAGDPSDTILASYYAFGARDFDLHGALNAMVKGATAVSGAPGQGWYPERPGIDEYLQRGYVTDTHMTNVAPVPNGASETEEYAVADFSIAQFARSLHERQIYRTYLKRSQDWANVFDKATGYMAGRDLDGAFMQKPITEDGQNGFQEGNSAQYTWMVPQDLSDLVAGIGGPAATSKRLDAYFSMLNAGQDKPYSWMGNEPSVSDPFVYLATGMPAREEAVVRKVQRTLWANTPVGQGGNDDLGTMSAWYVWCALGLFPLDPAVRGFAVTTPLFSHAVIDPPGGPNIVIDAPAASDANAYIESFSVNGKPWNRSWIDLPLHGTLHFKYALGDSPGDTWAVSPQEGPPSFHATAVQFPRATLAALQAPASVTEVPNAGQSIEIQASLPQSEAPVSLRWRALAPAGVHVLPSTGTIDLTPGATNAISTKISVDAGVLPGYYDVVFQANTADGAIVPRATAVVRVPGEHSAFYVLNEQSHTITPIDPVSHAFGPSITIGSGSRSIALSPDRRRLYMLNSDDGTIAVIDTDSQNTIASVGAGKGNSRMAIAPGGRTLWLANSDDSTLQTLDAASLHLGAPIKLAIAPDGIAIAPDGKTLYYSNRQTGVVVPFDLSSRTAGTPIAVGGHPSNLVISHSGRMLYVSEPPNHVVVPVNLSTATALSPIQAGVEAGAIAISPDDSIALVSNYFAGTVTEIDLATNAPIRTIPVGGGTEGAAFSSDGKTAFVVAHEDQCVVPIEVSSGVRGEPIPVGVAPVAVAGP